MGIGIKLAIIFHPFERLRRRLRSQKVLLGQVGWIGGSFAAQQIIRLVTSITLAWLLAPTLLGTMLLINTLRTGGELLTDVGIGQSIVSNSRGHESEFLNTAWSIKVIRGFGLFGLSLALTIPLSRIYADADLLMLLPAAGLIFIISGFASPSRYVLQKSMRVKKIALFDLFVSGASLAIHVVLVLIWPTIWGLIGALLLGTLVSTVGSFFLVRGLEHRFIIEGAALKDIVRFGKWIFFSSLVYFLSINFDKLYFAEAVPYAILGVYGIARTFSDTLLQIYQRMGNMLVFPKISGSTMRGLQLREKIGPMRWMVVCATAGTLALAVAFSDVFLQLAYDDRYRLAGIFLPILLIGCWFAILGTLADATALGVGKPAVIATSNLVKLLLIITLMPVVMSKYGLAASLFVLVGTEVVRYVVLSFGKRRNKISFLRQDLLATGLFFLAALGFRELTGIVGLTSGLDGWLLAMRELNG